jgi:hypothetical protein
VCGARALFWRRDKNPSCPAHAGRVRVRKSRAKRRDRRASRSPR